MDANGFLILFLAAAAVTILVMMSRLNRLSRNMQEQARTLFDAWKEREYETVRSQQGEIARREAACEGERWKINVEKGIRRDAVNRSQAVTVGKVIEHVAPYLPDFGHNPKDARFIGSPVDFVVFDGLNDETEVHVVFIEVKSGSSCLSVRERRVRDAIKLGRVRWKELRVSPDLAS